MPNLCVVREKQMLKASEFSICPLGHCGDRKNYGNAAQTIKRMPSENGESCQVFVYVVIALGVKRPLVSVFNNS